MINSKIADINLDSYIFNASGVNDSTLEELRKIGNSSSAAILMKSCTISPRDGNTEPRYSRLDFGAIQCMGLPNLGYEEYIKIASILKEEFEKPIIASIAGLSISDYKVMMEAFQKSKVDLIEVNLSCPNVEGKPIIGYSFDDIRIVLDEISGIGKKSFGLKLPPYYDISQFNEMTRVIKNSDVSFITCINSVGNTLVVDPERETPLLKPKKGFGALSGSYIKPLALANIRRFYELLEGEVSIIGVGGIKTGIDAFEFLLAGADAVQIGTTFEREGVNCFRRISKELEEIMKRKGYSSVSEVKGKLKFL